jgi:hypothetical protein
MRSGNACECPDGYIDDEDGVECVEELEVPEEEVIPTTPYDTVPCAVIEIDPSTLAEDYEIGIGFYYQFMLRNPDRVELSLPRENWLGIAGLSENGDYGSDATLGDRKLSIFQWPWEDNGM